MMRRDIMVANAGIISPLESKVNAYTQWANDCERKLLGLHCGQTLPRERHRNWAREIT